MRYKARVHSDISPPRFAGSGASFQATYDITDDLQVMGHLKPSRTCRSRHTQCREGEQLLPARNRAGPRAKNRSFVELCRFQGFAFGRCIRSRKQRHGVFQSLPFRVQWIGGLVWIPTFRHLVLAHQACDLTAKRHRGLPAKVFVEF